MSIFQSVKNLIFTPPSWVNTKLKPGHTSLLAWYGRKDWVFGYFPIGFTKSPSLLWFLMAAIFYALFPYEKDFDKAAVLDPTWICQRAFRNMILVNLYYGFWHITLYVMHWSARKFSPDSDGPSKSRLIHNIWYTNIGILQWTLWEVLFVHCYATNKIGYVSDAQLLSSPMEIIKLCFWILFVPFYRDVHFYFAHRLIHFRVLYKYVHSLHHRNNDVEPYSGMAMHPVEHLYYIGCVGLSLWIHASPFVLLWNGVHLQISPAAAHSGWEDHYISDQHHYIHHAKFECNYGNGNIPLDKWFGTFREKLGNKSESYKGEYKDDGSAEEEGSGVLAEKNYLNGGVSLAAIFPEKLDQVIYNLLNFFLLLLLSEAIKRMLAAKDTVMSASMDDLDINVVALLVSLGPIALACLLGILFQDKKHFLWPFHKDSKLNLSFHTVIGFLIVVVPVFHFVISFLSEEGSQNIPYHYLYGQK